MSVEIPSALIRRLQATLRKNAGVPSSYSPADPSLPSLSSLHDAALSSLDADPSLSYLRCMRCNRAAGLVRGPNSTICILCGRDRSDDVPAQSLSFNSTVASKKLLESLQLDGSEVIDLDTESKDSNKGQDTQDNGLVLPSVLDFELKWPLEKEAAVNISSDKAPECSQAVNLSGVDLDSFFSDSRNKIFSAASSVTTEELMPSKQTISTKSHVSSGSDNFASFKDLQTPIVAMSSDSTKCIRDFADSFADWEAGFQSASSQAMQLASESIDHYRGSSTAGLASLATDVAVSVESKSVDLFEGSTTEVSSHATSAPTFIEHTNANHEINNDGNSREFTNEWGQFSSSGKWTQDDLWGNPPDQLKNTSKTDDNKLKDDVQCTTSIGESCGQDEMWATSSMKASNSKNKRDDDEDAFDDALDEDAFDDALDIWQDFASSKEAPGVSSNTWIQSGNEIAPNEHASILSVDLQETQSYASPGALGEQGADKVNDALSNTSASTGIADFFNVKSTNGNSLEAWQDIASSNGTSGDLSNLWTQSTTLSTLNEHASGTKSVNSQEMEFGSFLDSDSISAALGDQKDPSEASAINLDASVPENNTNEFDKTKQSDNSDDSLNDWQEFTSSKEAPGGLPNSWTSGTEAMSMEHDPGVKPVDPQEQEFDSFLYSNFFSVVDVQKGSSHANDTQLDALFYSSSTGFKSGCQKDTSQSSVIKFDAPVSSNIVTEFDKTKQSDDNDDSLDDWQDFTSSKEASGVSPNSWASGAESTSIVHARETMQVDPRDSEFGSFLFSDSFSRLDGQRSSTHLNDIQLDVLVSNSSTRFESGGQKDPSGSSAIKLDAPVSSNIVNEFDKTKQSDDNYDSEDDWQDFTNSKEASWVLPNSWASSAEATSMEHAPGTKQVDPQDSEFGSFVFSDFFSGTDGQRGSTHTNDIQLDALASSSSNEFKSGGQKDHNEAIAVKIDGPVSSNGRNEFDKTGQSDDNDDSLDFWQEFSSSKEASVVLSNSRSSSVEATSIKRAPGMKPVDPKDSEFGSFLYPGSFSGVDGQKFSTRANDIQIGALYSNSNTGFNRCGQKDLSEASDIKLVALVSSNGVNEFDTTKQSDDNDDSLDDWQDFISSNEASGVLPNSWASVAEATSMEHALGSNQVDPQDSEFGSFVFSDSFSGVDGQRFSTHVNDIQLETLASNPGAGFRSEKNMNDNNGPFGSWKDFTSSNEVSEGLSNLSKQTGTKTTLHEHTAGMKSVDLEDMEFGDFLQSDTFSGINHQGGSTKANDVEFMVSTSCTKEFNNIRDINDNFDPFKAWQDYTSSTDAQGSLASLSTQPDTRAISYEHASGTKSLDLQDMGFGSFLHSDSLLGALVDVKSSSAVNGMQDTSVSYRMNGTDKKVAAASSIPGAVDADESNVSASNRGRTNSKVDMLLAQMSGLSFMLDDNLSVPKKVDSSNLKS